MHLHLGVHQLIATFVGVVLIGTLWRIIATKLSDSAIGQAMAFMY